MSAGYSDKVHTLDLCIEGAEVPERLNDPFDYTPHPLCKAAAAEVVAHLRQHPEWQEELNAGKMLGVAVVRTPAGDIGFTAAFSGNLAGRNEHPYFVPPVYDMLQADGFFRRGEAAITEINRRTEQLTASPERTAALKAVADAEAMTRQKLDSFREKMRQAKALRDIRRTAASAAEAEAIDNESRRQKSELRQLKEMCRQEVEAARAASEPFEMEIAALKAERKRLSEELQAELFRHFEMVDAHGRKRSLCEIFAATPQKVPPAGAGECAAPKLLQYAFLHSLTPLAIAEFWYGESPRGEVRRHGSFYPACRGKCKPILDFMLDGVELDRSKDEREMPMPSIIYEDDCTVVVDKPAGMLSVDGKTGALSVERWLQQRFSPDTKLVHRLDMATSGLLLAAKDAESFKYLQSQFARHTVRKRYTALLSGDIPADNGRIELPMRPEPNDRPRQVIDPVHGKSAITIYKVSERRAGRTLVSFEPVTGRTHQLRVHAASPAGLNAPIVGDTLYGAEAAARLCLHNEYLEFTHPLNGRRLRFELPVHEDFFTL